MAPYAETGVVVSHTKILNFQIPFSRNLASVKNFLGPKSLARFLFFLKINIHRPFGTTKKIGRKQAFFSAKKFSTDKNHYFFCFWRRFKEYIWGMKKIALLVFCFFLFKGYGQNLVPNPSFENYSSCPIMATQIYLATGWIAPTVGGTSDYFNSCDNFGNVGVPSNFFGHQMAHSGNGYTGLVTYNISNLREYIQSELDTVLKPLHRYCVQFYVSLADTALISCHTLGVYFSDTAVSENNTYPLNFIPQINNNNSNPLFNKTVWTMISGDFIAIGGEHYITIGNFSDNINSDTIHVAGGVDNEAYYYIDDISVVDCTYDGVSEIKETNTITISPNPNNGQMTLSYHLAQAAELSIYDMQGRRLITYSIPPNNQTLNLNLEELNTGIYYYSIHTKDKQLKTEKLIIVK